MENNVPKIAGHRMTEHAATAMDKRKILIADIAYAINHPRKTQQGESVNILIYWSDHVGVVVDTRRKEILSLYVDGSSLVEDRVAKSLHGGRSPVRAPQERPKPPKEPNRNGPVVVIKIQAEPKNYMTKEQIDAHMAECAAFWVNLKGKKE